MSKIKELTLELFNETGSGPRYDGVSSADTPVAVSNVDRKIGMGYDPQKRRQIKSGVEKLVKYGAGLALGAAGVSYGISEILPQVLGQQKPELDVGMLQIQVNPDGQIGDGEYADSNDYRMSGFDLINPNSPEKSGHMYAKYSDYTYLGFDLTDAVSLNKLDTLFLYFDTNNSGMKIGAEGFYNLFLEYDKEFKEIAKVQGTDQVGTPFFQFFSRGQNKDYDWQTFFGPSKLSSTPHTQIEVQIKTDILTKYSREIGFNVGYGWKTYILNYPRDGTDIKMKFIEQVIPEPTLIELGIGAGIVTTAAINKIRKNKTPLSRRQLFSPSALAQILMG